MNLDQIISLSFNQWAGAGEVSRALTVFFAEYFPYLVVIVFLYFTFRSRSVLYERAYLFAEGVGAGIIARGVVEILRVFIHRPRPFVDIPSITALISETSYSFPSGHATFFFALATTVYVHNKRWGVWFFVGATGISLARVMAGVHYASDIICGALLGIVVSVLVRSVVRRARQRTAILPPQ